VNNTIKIGPIEYNITLVSNYHEGNECLDGQFVHSQSNIILEETLGGPARRATLWHEIIHGILIHAGYQEHDEGHVSSIAYGIMQVLADNPWIASIEKDED